MKTVYIYFGERAAGKTCHAQHTAQYMEIPFFDLDVQTMTPQQIQQQAEKHEWGIAVAQMLPTNEQRRYIQRYLEERGTRTVFYYVKPDWQRHLRQMWQKPNAITLIYRWLTNNQFEPPTHEYRLLWWEI